MRKFEYLRNISSKILFDFVESHQGKTRLDFFKRDDDSISINCSKLIQTLRGTERQNYQYNFMDTDNSYLVLFKEGIQTRRDITEEFKQYIMKVNSQESTIEELENV